MRPEAPDSRFFAEIAELNRAFLRLVAEGWQCRIGRVFGLDAAIAGQIARLSESQCRAIAETPCLLVTFRRPLRPNLAVRVAESRADASDPRWSDAVRVFTAGLVTYAWQAVRSDALRAALCLGTLAPEFRELTFTETQSYPHAGFVSLEARFHAHPRLWPDLLDAAHHQGEDALRMVRLGVVQLALSDSAQRASQGAASLYTRAAAAAIR